MTGGTDKLRYRLSVSQFIDNDGVLITDKDKYRRMNVSGFISPNVTKWFTQEATFSYAHSKKNGAKVCFGRFVYSTLVLLPLYPGGQIPERISPQAMDYLFLTPQNQIRWSIPEKILWPILAFFSSLY